MESVDPIGLQKSSEANTSSQAAYSMSSKLPLLMVLFVFTLISVLYIGWQIRDEYLLSAQFGLGYALGVTGSLMMLLLLVYPLKKRFYDKSLFLFSTKSWFRLHMLFGFVGPVLILYHCNFSLGSTNSNIALGSMLLMVFSGVIGRFIYGKIHFGLYGKKAELQDLKTQKIWMEKQIDDDRNDECLVISEALLIKMRLFEKAILKRRGLVANLLNTLFLGLTTRVGYFSLVRCLKRDQQSNTQYTQLSGRQKRYHLDPVRRHIASYLSTIRKIAGLAFYERLFSLWHMLHMPIFFMLIITGFVHVFAVHTY